MYFFVCLSFLGFFYEIILKAGKTEQEWKIISLDL